MPSKLSDVGSGVASGEGEDGAAGGGPGVGVGAINGVGGAQELRAADDFRGEFRQGHGAALAGVIGAVDVESGGAADGGVEGDRGQSRKVVGTGDIPTFEPVARRYRR